ASGVDISDASIKWMTLSLAPEKERRVLSFGDVPLESGIVVGGQVKDVQALATALMQIKPHLGLPSAHASLPEEAAYVFGMTVPEGIDRKQILSMIEFEFDGRVPIAPSASVYDYSTIARTAEGEEVGVVVFPKEVSETYAEAFAGAGIELLSLEVEARSVA